MKSSESLNDKKLIDEIRYEYTVPFFNRPRIFRKLHKKSMIALDLGSNIGGFSIAFSKNFSKIYAVEAHVKNVTEANVNQKNLKISNTIIFNRALHSQDDQKINLYRYTDDLGNFRNSDFTTTDWESDLVNSKQLTKQAENVVETISLTKLFKLISAPIDFCKCDIEGAEYDAFLGQDLSPINFLVMELHYNALGKQKTQELIDHLLIYFDYYRSSDRVLFNSWPPPQILRMINKSNRQISGKLGSRIPHSLIIKMLRLIPIGRI